METDARIDLYINDIEKKVECTIFHTEIRNMIKNSLRSEKLRVGMWEAKDAEELSKLHIVEQASDKELNRLRTELENMNHIYFLGCKKLINERKKMDLEERNPNMKKKRKRHGSTFRREYGCCKKTARKLNTATIVNQALKYSDNISEAELKKKAEISHRKEKIKKSEMNRGRKYDRNENADENVTKTRDELISDCKGKRIGKHVKPTIKKKRAPSHCITEFLEKGKRKYDEIGENELTVSMENIIIKRNQKKARRSKRINAVNDSVNGGKKNERNEKRKKRNNLIVFDEDGNEDNDEDKKEAKRSRTVSEDIRRFFRKEDVH
jgi:hypothetical protein